MILRKSNYLKNTRMKSENRACKEGRGELKLEVHGKIAKKKSIKRPLELDPTQSLL